VLLSEEGDSDSAQVIEEALHSNFDCRVAAARVEVRRSA
jgi:hypothetical protein